MCLNRCIDDVEVLGCFVFMLKYTIVFVNGLFVLAGVILIGFGTFANISSLLGKNYTGSLSVYSGAITSFVSGSGLFSSFFGSIYGLVFYNLMLFLIFAAQAVAVI